MTRIHQFSELQSTGETQSTLAHNGRLISGLEILLLLESKRWLSSGFAHYWAPHSFWRGVQAEVPLGDPDVLVCSVGTEIFFEHTGEDPEPDKKWFDTLERGWNRDAAIEAAAGFPQLKLQVSHVS